MRLVSPPGSPAWLDGVLRRIRQAVGEPWDTPLRLQSIPTASLPTAADYPGGIVYDETTAEVKRSNGTAWASVGGSGGVSDGDKGDITVSSSGAVWTVDAKAITLAKMADVATGTVFYRKTALTGVPEVQTLATLKTDLGLTGTNSGDQTTISGNAGTATALATSRNFSISGGGITATAVGFNGSAAVVLSASVDAAHITLARMANLAANSIIGNNTGSPATPIALTAAQTNTLLGCVVGPGSSTDNAVVRWDTTTGKLAQDSNFLVNDAGVPAVTSLTGLAGAIGATIADYFSTTITLDASSTYEIECLAYFLKTTSGTVIWTWTFSSAPTAIGSFLTYTPVTGYTTTTITGAVVNAEAHVQAQTTMAHAATAALTSAVFHTHRFRVHVRTNAQTTIQLRATESAGTITPQAGSYMRATKII